MTTRKKKAVKRNKEYKPPTFAHYTSKEELKEQARKNPPQRRVSR